MVENVIEVEIPGSSHLLVLNKNDKGTYSYSLLLNQGRSMSLCNFYQVLTPEEKLYYHISKHDHYLMIVGDTYVRGIFDMDNDHYVKLDSADRKVFEQAIATSKDVTYKNEPEIKDNMYSKVLKRAFKFKKWIRALLFGS